MLFSTLTNNCRQTTLAAVFLLILTGCERSTSSDIDRASKFEATDSQSQPAWLQEITSESGLTFSHEVGRFADYEMPTIMGSGCSIVDYDRDGLLDLYLVNGKPDTKEGAADLHRGDAFYRRLSNGKYVDVAGVCGVKATEFGMGAWWGDYDADGFPDLFLTNVGGNRLFHNEGDGTFRPVEIPSGVVENAWSTAAAWCDFNSDGLLDLIAVNYVDYLPGQYCEGAGGQREFCGPSTYPGTVDRLLLNLGECGESTESPFRDETVARGLGNKGGKGLGLLAQDLNADGRLDFYIANDMEANHLWIQQTDGTFQEQADLLGLARNFLGEMEASMGVVSGDWNQDGLTDLFLTHLAGETNTLYLGTEHGYWQDATFACGLGPPGISFTSFGIANLDFEHDGDLDLLIANGGVQRLSSEINPDDPRATYRQHNSIYLRDETRLSFHSEVLLGGQFTAANEISRSLATGDLDSDGDLDVLLSNCAGPARLFENVAPKKGQHWLMLRLIDRSGNRDALGASVRVFLEEGECLSRRVNPYSGYLSSSDPTLHFGLGPSQNVQLIEVRWSDGSSETFENLPVDMYWTVVRKVGVFSDVRQTNVAGTSSVDSQKVQR